MKTSRLVRMAPMVASAMLLAAAPVVARTPFVYASKFSYDGSLQSCIDGATKALKIHGFDKNVRVLDVNPKLKDVKADHSVEYVAALIECDKKRGLTMLVVAGPDNDAVYEAYEKLYSADW